MFTKDVKEVFDVISAKFDKISKLRDQALIDHREIIKIASLTIRAVHRAEFVEAEKLLDSARVKLKKLKDNLKDTPEVYYSGYVSDCQKEFAEASVTLSLIKEDKLLTPEEIGVDYPAYLNGVGEAIGELRRNIVDKIRNNKMGESEKLLAWMDELYYMLISMDYPDAVTMGLRRTADIARSLIEKTSGELAVHTRQSALEQKMQKLEEKLK